MEIKTNNLQIVKNVLTDVVRQINKENILDNIKKYIFENVDKNLINAINYKWGYKLTAKTCKPLFDILETSEVGSRDYNAAYKFYIFLTKCYNFDDIDEPFYETIDAFMREGLSFFGATLLDLTVTDFTKKAYAMTYQIGVAKKCFEKDETHFYWFLENLFSISQDFVMSSARTKYYYYAFRFGFIAQICNDPKTVPNFEHIVEVFRDLEKAIDKSVVSALGSDYTKTKTNLASKYFYMLYEKTGRDATSYYAALDGEQDSLIPYDYQFWALIDHGNLPHLKLAEDHIFTSKDFNEKVLSQKNIENMSSTLIYKIVYTALKEYNNPFGYIAALCYSPNQSEINSYAETVFSEDILRSYMKKFWTTNPKCKKANTEAIESLLTKIDDFENKIAKMSVTSQDKDILIAISGVDKTRRDWQDRRWQATVDKKMVDAFKYYYDSYSDEQELSRQLLLRLNTVYDNYDFITTLYTEKISSPSTAQLISTKAYKVYLENDESFNILFNNANINNYLPDALINALSINQQVPVHKQLVMLCLYYSTSKKVLTTCEKIINANFDDYEDIFAEWQNKNIGTKKDNTLIIKAITQKNCTSNITLENSASVEQYTNNEGLANSKVLKTVDFSQFPAVAYSDGGQVSTKTLEVIYDKYFSMTELYRLPLCDSIVKHFAKDSFVAFTNAVYTHWVNSEYDSKLKALAAPYCFYTSNSNLVKLKKECEGLCDRGKHLVSAYLIDAIAMNGGKYALMITDNMSKKFPYPKSRETAKNAMEKAAKKYKISTDKLSDLIIPSYDFDSSGKRLFEYGGNTLTLQLMPEGDIKIFNDDKEVKALPTASTDDMKFQKNEFSTLKKEIKNVVKFQSARFESNLMTGYPRSYRDFKENIMLAPAINGLVCSLIWGIYSADGDLKTAFRVNHDGSLTDAEYNDVTPQNDDIVALLHPCDCTDAQLKSWRDYIADNEINQPFKQIAQTVLYIPIDKIVKNVIGFSDFDFQLSHILKIVNRFNLTRLPVCDGAGFAGYYMENSENDIGAELLLDGLYIGCGAEEGTDFELTFYKPSASKMDYYYWSHDSSNYLAPDKEVPTRFSSTLLNALQQSYGGSLNLLESGECIKTHFILPKNSGNLSFEIEDPQIKSVTKQPSKPIQAVATQAPKQTESTKIKEANAPTVKVTVTTASNSENGDTTYLEFIEGTSSKFWKVTVLGNKHTVTYGRIGTDGVSAEKTFGSDSEARADADKLVASKVKKGYVRK